jgi:hypothetical protein
VLMVGLYVVGEADRECVSESHLAVRLVADIDGVVLAVGADAPGAEQPSPAGDPVPAQWRVEDEGAPIDVVVAAGLLEDAVCYEGFGQGRDRG